MRNRLGQKALSSPLLVVGMTLVFAVAVAGIAYAIADQPPALPPEKQALLDSMATADAEAANYPAISKSDAEAAWATQAAIELTTTPQVTVTPVIGIRDVQIGPFQSQDALIQNQWQDWVGGKFTHVYAAVITQDPDQGLVAVSEDPVGQLSLNFDVTRYLTPARDGAVSITSVDNLQLTLVSEKGTTFVFDLPSRTFK